MNIGLDLDGVLYEWLRAVYIELQNFNGLKASYIEFSSQPLKYVSDSFLTYLSTVDILYGMVQPEQASIDFVKYARSRGHTIFYITARPKSSRFVTEEWLKDNGFPYVDNLIFTKNKPIELLKNAVDFYVDDRIHEFEKASRVCVTFLKDTLYNRNIYTKYRISSLNELLPVL